MRKVRNITALAPLVMAYAMVAFFLLGWFGWMSFAGVLLLIDHITRLK